MRGWIQRSGTDLRNHGNGDDALDPVLDLANAENRREAGDASNDTFAVTSQATKSVELVAARDGCTSRIASGSPSSRQNVEAFLWNLQASRLFSKIKLNSHSRRKIGGVDVFEFEIEGAK